MTDRDDLLHCAGLAKIRLKPDREELAGLAAEYRAMVELAARNSRALVESDDESPLTLSDADRSRAKGLDALRDDSVGIPLERESLIPSAGSGRSSDGRFFLVPRVIEDAAPRASGELKAKVSEE